MTTEEAFNKLINSEITTEIRVTSAAIPKEYIIRATGTGGRRTTVTLRDGKVVPGTRRIRSWDQLRTWLSSLTIADDPADDPYEYVTTTCQRKTADNPPEGVGWEEMQDKFWRDDFTDNRTYRRLKTTS